MSNERVDGVTRLIGWLIVVFAVYGLMHIAEWLEQSDMYLFFKILITFILGMGGWIGLLMLHDKFDILGDKK